MTIPILLSVPHAGLGVPEDLEELCVLTPEEIAADGDEGAKQIYAMEAEVAAFVTTSVARAVVDMNREESDRRKDGVVKTHTCWDVPIWREPLTDEQVERILEEHHRPYHRSLSAAAEQPGILFAVDGHTMAAVGPPVGPDHGRPRPWACVSNADGTCPDAWARRFAELLASELDGEVLVNEPFRGGYITRSHSSELPWMQLELSRQDFASFDEKRTAVLRSLEQLVTEVRAGR